MERFNKIVPDLLVGPTIKAATEENKTAMDMKMPELSKDEKNTNPTVETNNIAALLDDESAAFGKNDFVPEVTDSLAGEVAMSEDDLLLTNEPYDELIPEEFIDTDLKDDNFEILLDDDSITSEKDDFGSEVDLLLDEVPRDEELGANSTELSEDDLLITDEPHEKLTFDELIDADYQDDLFEILPDDDHIASGKDDFELEANLLADEVPMHEEQEVESTELLEDKVLARDELFDELTFEELVETDLESDTSAEESGLDQIFDTYLFTEKDDADQIAFATDNAIITDCEASVAVEKTQDKVAPSDVTKQRVQYQPSEKKLHKSDDDLSALSAIERSAASVVQNIRVPAAEKGQYVGKHLSKKIIGVAIFVVLGGGAGLWYGYNSIGSGTQPSDIRQDGQGNLLHRDNLNRYAEQEVVKTNQPEIVLQEEENSINDQPNIPKEQLGSQTRKNSMDNSPSLVEREITETTTSVVDMQNDAPLKETQKEVESVHRTSIMSEDILVPERRSEAETIVPINTSNVEGTISQSDKIIRPTGVVSEQSSWGINLASFQQQILAESEQKRLNALGFQAIVHQIEVSGTIWYRVRVEGFKSAVTARKYMKDIQLEYGGVEDAWVSKGQF